MSKNEEIWFYTATVFARKIDVKRRLVSAGVHRMQVAKVDEGYIIIEQRWFPPSK